MFPNSYFFAVNGADSEIPQNIIFVGYNGSETIHFTAANVTGNKNPIIAGLAEKQIDISKFDLSSHAMLTDDFAPVEYLTAKELERLGY